MSNFSFFHSFSSNTKLLSANSFNWEESKICHLGKGQFFNSTKRQILDRSELKGLAENNKKVTEKLKFVLGRVENVMGKEENAGYKHFLLFP